MSLFRIAGIIAVVSVACSTTQVAPVPELPTPPGYVQVPHPEGLDIGDLVAIFTDRSAPSPEELKACDDIFHKLRKKTDSRDELQTGARELVRLEPVKFHWCFYARLLELDGQLKAANYIDERQRLVLDAYVFLTPVSRAFLAEYKDSRYLRWAITRYRKLSEHVFYRRVELSPLTTEEIATSHNPWGLMRGSGADEKQGVLEKYGLLPPPPTEQTVEGPPPTATLPVAAVTPSPSDVPVPAEIAASTEPDPAPTDKTPAAAQTKAKVRGMASQLVQPESKIEVQPAVETAPLPVPAD